MDRSIKQNKMIAYQVMKDVGLGVMEAPTTTTGTSYIFSDKKKAEDKAKELWLKYTTAADRASSWCPIHYHVNEIEIK